MIYAPPCVGGYIYKGKTGWQTPGKKEKYYYEEKTFCSSKPAETTAAPAAVDKTEAEAAAEGVANVDMMPYYLNAEDSAKNDEQIYNTIKEIADSLEQ